MKSFHIAQSVEGALSLNDRELGDRLVERGTGRKIPATEARALCREALAEGFEVFPPCDHHDARGYCLGHEDAGEVDA